jgi:hypothetical protein
MGEAQRRKQAAAEVAALAAVYGHLPDLLNALRDARTKIHQEALLAVVDAQIERQLQTEEQLRRAFVDCTGRPVQDPY